AIVRIGVYELLYRLNMPYRVVLNEGINLAKDFGADGSHKYVNGILDKVAQQTRAGEIKAKGAR
ncbi:MAG: transcription antitermination factor NusB, partial [Methylobacter sp.]